jgi:hypothetical protein
LPFKFQLAALHHGGGDRSHGGELLGVDHDHASSSSFPSSSASDDATSSVGLCRLNQVDP